MMIRLAAAFASALALTGCGASDSAAPGEDVDYALASAWLCRPGRADACAVPLDAAVVEADGSVTVARHVAAMDPRADCFYVYPTVSRDGTMNADLEVGPEERAVIAAQLARFSAACRPYAPVYRQQSLKGLRAKMLGRRGGDAELAYRDVRAAFAHYLEHDNDGRPFVLYGHSQGTRMLVRLIQEEVQDEPVRDRMIAAYLLGLNVMVPNGGDESAGTFARLPLCEAAEQTGCVVAYSSFLSDEPPPRNALFGRSETVGARPACVNPAALLDRSDLEPYLPTQGSGKNARKSDAWTTAPVEQPWVTLPGLLSARCVVTADQGYLAVTVNADPNDPRTDDIGGEVVFLGRKLGGWGLHLLDAGLAQGDLIELLEVQTAAYEAGAD